MVLRAENGGHGAGVGREPGLKHDTRLDIFEGGDAALQLRDLLMSSLHQSKQFIITEEEDKADAVLKGAGDDDVFTDTHQTSDGLNAHSQIGSGSRKIARHPRPAGFHWISAPPLNCPIAAAMPIMIPYALIARASSDQPRATPATRAVGPQPTASESSRARASTSASVNSPNGL